MATWTPTDGGRPPEAAVLLVPIHVDARGAIKLKRSGELQVNPVLLHALETEYGCQGVAELRYDKCGQGMFCLPDLPRLRAIEIIGWIGNRNIPKHKIMNY